MHVGIKMSLRAHLPSLAALALAVFPAGAFAQAPVGSGGSVLPAIAPTNASASPASNTVGPLAAVATSADRPGARHHRAQINCAGGQLEVKADNSSLNNILRAVSQCTGMKITGGVLDQRVFGNYGPAAPATVLATLLDGTNTNVLLRETAADQPAELILTPRTEGPTPPNPSATAEEDAEDDAPTPAQPGGNTGNNVGNVGNISNPSASGSMSSPAQPGIAYPGPGVVSGPVSIPQPINNVNGSPSNSSPTAANYPTTNSVPLDSLPTPSTTPSQSGIVDSPNPPPAGSDTAALLNDRTTNMPGSTTITAQPTSPTVSPGGTNTTLPSPDSAAANSNQPNGNQPNGNQPNTDGSGAAGGALTPQQVYEQLQRLRQAGAQAASPGQTQSQPQAQPQNLPQPQPQ